MHTHFHLCFQASHFVGEHASLYCHKACIAVIWSVHGQVSDYWLTYRIDLTEVLFNNYWSTKCTSMYLWRSPQKFQSSLCKQSSNMAAFSQILPFVFAWTCDSVIDDITWKGYVVICEARLGSYLHWCTSESGFCQWPLYQPTKQQCYRSTQLEVHCTCTVYYIWATSTLYSTEQNHIAQASVVPRYWSFNMSRPTPTVRSCCLPKAGRAKQKITSNKEDIYTDRWYVISQIAMLCVCVCSPHVNL